MCSFEEFGGLVLFILVMSGKRNKVIIRNTSNEWRDRNRNVSNNWGEMIMIGKINTIMITKLN